MDITARLFVTKARRVPGSANADLLTKFNETAEAENKFESATTFSRGFTVSESLTNSSRRSGGPDFFLHQARCSPTSRGRVAVYSPVIGPPVGLSSFSFFLGDYRLFRLTAIPILGFAVPSPLRRPIWRTNARVVFGSSEG